MLFNKSQFFRILNFVDCDANETRKAFQSDLINTWRGFGISISENVQKYGYDMNKEKLDKECGFIATRFSCYAVFLLHAIGQNNLTVLNLLQNRDDKNTLMKTIIFLGFIIYLVSNY